MSSGEDMTTTALVIAPLSYVLKFGRFYIEVPPIDEVKLNFKTPPRLQCVSACPSSVGKNNFVRVLFEGGTKYNLIFMVYYSSSNQLSY
jgi:hypothetical protein